MLLLFYFISIYLAVLKCVIRDLDITKINRLWLTQIFLYRFYKLILLNQGFDLAAVLTALKQPNPNCD